MNSTDWCVAPVEDLGLSNRAYGCLKRAGIETVGQVVATPDHELLIPDLFGRRTIAEVRKKVAEYVDAQKEVDHADRE